MLVFITYIVDYKVNNRRQVTLQTQVPIFYIE